MYINQVCQFCSCEYTTIQPTISHLLLMYVLSILKEEKDLSAVALVTGKVKYILSNLLISVSIFL